MYSISCMDFINQIINSEGKQMFPVPSAANLERAKQHLASRYASPLTKAFETVESLARAYDKEDAEKPTRKMSKMGQELWNILTV